MERLLEGVPVDRSFFPDWLFRIIIAVGIFSFGLLVYWLFNRLTKTKLSHLTQENPFVLDGRPIILYFTTPDCAPCKTVQQPALKKLEDQLGNTNLQIVQVDATEDSNLARQWNVMSVPTTFIIDQHGHVKHINHGVTNFEKLQRQLSAT